MKHISSFSYNKHFVQENSEDIEKKTINVINELFEDLKGLVPAHAYAWSDDRTIISSKKAWIRAFMYSKISDLSIINRGLNKLSVEGCNFMPSPGVFIALCKAEPEDVGAPDIDKAYQEASAKLHPSYGSNKNWSHPCVKYAAQCYGRDILTGTQKETRSRFKELYLASCELYANGDISEQLEHTTPPPYQTIDPLYDGPHTKGKYEFARKGILKMYEHVKTEKECIEWRDKIELILIQREMK